MPKLPNGKKVSGFIDYDRKVLKDASTDDWIYWVEYRLGLILLKPMDAFFTETSPYHDKINAGDKTFFLAGVTVILCTIEAMGTFYTGCCGSGASGFSYKKWISKYMPGWTGKAPSGLSITEWLWDSARCGLAHQLGFKTGGIEAYGRKPPKWCEDKDGIKINPDAFYGDFKAGVQQFFQDLRKKSNDDLRSKFKSRFEFNFLKGR